MVKLIIEPPKCPLLHHKENNPDVYPGEVFEDCFKEECAWWDAKFQQCIAITIAEQLLRQANSLSNTASKISLGGKG